MILSGPNYQSILRGSVRGYSAAALEGGIVVGSILDAVIMTTNGECTFK
jgi:hypothetical protein